MKKYNNIKSKKYEFSENKYEVSITDTPMICPETISFLYDRNRIVINEIVSEFEENIPNETTRLVMNINPSENNIRDYYSFNGIEKILNNLFQIGNLNILKELKKSDLFLKVHFVKNEFYTIPQIRIEVLIFQNINDECFSFFSDFLNSKLLFLIGSVGKIERLKISHPDLLRKIFEIPLLLGHPGFKNEGLLQILSTKQILELNYLFVNTIIKLDTHKTIIENKINPFDELRDMIVIDRIEKKNTNLISDEIKNFVLNGNENVRFIKDEFGDYKYEICNKVNEDNDMEVDDLPF